MPFKSEKQRKFMWSQHPEIAKRWESEGKAYVTGRKRRQKVTRARGR